VTQTLGIDYSFARPSPAAIRAAGYTFVIRYLTGAGKALTIAERDALRAEGLGIALVFETTGTDAPGGAAAGQADGEAAKAALDALGFPAGYPVFFATDFSEPAADFPANAGYLRAASAACGRPAGPYGELALVTYLVSGGVCGYAWQSEAWSGTAVYGHANLYQRVTPTRSIAGSGTGDYDEDVLVVPFALWYPGAAAPAPAPSPGVPAARRNVYTPLAVDGNFGPASTRAEQFVSFGGDTADCDGIFGFLSRKSMQAHLGVTQDGIIGPVTVKALQKRVGAAQDGDWGPATTARLQDALNKGTY
jgi:hypothetical protein